MYAIIESCGKQYKVQEGDQVYFEKLDIKEGDSVKFDKVLLISDNYRRTQGHRQPYTRVEIKSIKA